VTQHGGELLPAGRRRRLLAERLDQPDPAAHLGRLRAQAVLGVGEHGRRRVEDGDPEAESGQGQRLVACASADVEDRRRRRGEVSEQLPVEDKGAHLPLDRGLRAFHEGIGQRAPGVM
jgi:hypothetical protein